MNEIEIVTKKRNCLFVFPAKFQYKDLAPVFPELLDYFMRICNQYPEEGGDEYMFMLIEQNMRDLRKNRKPMGHNREARYRMIFPYGRKGVQFFIYPRIAQEESKIDDITEKVSTFLEQKGIKHDILWNQMVFLQEEKKR